MKRPQAAILHALVAALLAGSHSHVAAQQSMSGSGVIAQSGSDPLPIDPKTVNVLKANVAARTASTAESAPEGFWIQSWNDPQQTFTWRIRVPLADDYTVDVLVSGAAGSQILIAGPSNKISLTIPEGNDHWGNNWNKIAAPGWLRLPAGTSTVTVSSPNAAGIATNKNRYNGMAFVSLELIARSHKEAIEQRIQDARSSAKWLAEAQYGLMFQWGEWGYPEHGEGKPWPKMIDDFNVEKFADMVQSTGAGYVIWSATWRSILFPGSYPGHRTNHAGTHVEARPDRRAG